METPTISTPRVVMVPPAWKLRFILGSVIIFAVGGTLTFFVGRWADRQQRDDLFEVVHLVRYSIDPDLIQQLSGQPTDTTSPAYTELRQTFVELGNATEKIRYIYLMGERDKKIFFYVDSQPDRFNQPGQPALAVPGEEYTDVTDGVRQVFSVGASTVVGPETDKWGTFISGLVPVRNSENKIVALLGIDVDAADFISNTRSRQYLPALATFFIVVLYAVIVLRPVRRAQRVTASQPLT